MDIKEIKLLVKLMAENDLTEMDLTDGDNKICLKRGGPAGAVMVSAPAAAPVAIPAAASAPAAAAEVEAPKSDLLEITSPMVGTFYSSPSPDSDSFVSVGASVDDNAVVCIVEAMKVMNEIKAECSGTVVEVCVKNAQPVEFGQVLYRVKPN